MTPRPIEPIRAAGVVLLTREVPPAFLLMRHHDRWDLPKGHCEHGESYRQAALRELQEETGIDPATIELDDDYVLELCYPVRYPRWDGTFEKHVRYFLGRLATQLPLKLTEHEGYQWIPWAPPHHIQEQTIDPLLAAVACRVGGS